MDIYCSQLSNSILPDRIVIQPRKRKVQFFIDIFLNNISLLIPNKPTKDFLVNLGTLLKGTVSQIFYLRLIFYFLAKNGKHFAIFENLISLIA